MKGTVERLGRIIEGASEGGSGEIYANVADDCFESAARVLSSDGFNLINLFCAEDFESHRGLTLFYAFEKAGKEGVLVLVRRLKDGKATSVEELYPTACWYEREIQDGFGTAFEGAFDTRRLFLHEPYPEGFHPLLKSFKNRRIRVREEIRREDEYKFKEVKGEEVYQIPVGPVHAGIIEPGHFRFSVIGENIFNLEVRMFYKHRGIEKLAEGKAPAECVPIAEAISGDETAANTVAYCNTVEAIWGIKAPPRAWHLRTVLLEMERIYSHLGDMAGMVVDVAYPAGASPFFILREEMLRQNERLTGSRFMRGAVDIGGLKRDIEDARLNGLSHYLSGFHKRFEEASEAIQSAPSVIDRFEKTGIIKKELIAPLNISGPAARASGACADARADHPYGIYALLDVKPRVCEAGDVLARFNVKHMEVSDSVSMIHRLVRKMPEGEVNTRHNPRDGYAMTVVEAPRGQNVHWAYVKDGRISRYKVRTASFCNWQAIEHAVLGNIVPDFPLINKSLNLSYAGCDL
jgi:formate hydrogenlyase subunit 5